MHGRGQQDLVVVLHCENLEGLNDLRKERIGNFGNDQPKNTTPPRHQSPSLRIRKITELVDYLPHSFGKLRIDGGNVVNRSGYGGGGNFGSPSDLADIHGAAWKNRRSMARVILP